MSVEAMKAAVGQFEYILERINRDIIPHDGDEFHETLTGLRQAIKQAEKQKPFAWIPHDFAEDPSSIIYSENEANRLRAKGAEITPLYTAPPMREWQGLTVKEIFDAYNSGQGLAEFARAIEAKLKEKNNG